MPHRPILLVPTAVPVSLTWGGLLPMGLLAAGFVAMVHTGSLVLMLAAAAIGGIGGAVSLVVHEFGHVLASRRVAGVRAARVSLMWGGAATYFNGAYRSGRDQIRVALGGPTASFLFAFPVVAAMALPLPMPVRYATFLLAFLNLTIAVLTLLPVAPLDGHKLVLGTLWWVFGSEATARRTLKRFAVAAIGLDLVCGSFLVVERPLDGGIAVAIVAVAFVQRHFVHRSRR